MELKHFWIGFASAALLTIRAQAQSASTAAGCPTSIAPRHGAPSVAPGFRAQVVANNLRDPRGILYSEGGLLVVEQAHGIVRIPLSGSGACVNQSGPPTQVVDNNELNHGIALSQDGRTLYASSHSNVYSWPFNSQEGKTTGNSSTIVEGMAGDGHTTRTLLLLKKVPSLLLVSRGSAGNIDLQTLDVTTGVSTIKAFNISNVTNTAYQHPRDGLLLGWGLRNSVGVGEDPVTGSIYSVENSVDNIQRSGRTVNQNNPGEELNFHGYLNGTQTSVQGKNYGYPTCFAAWNATELPDNQGLQTGSNFAMGTQNATVNDTFCSRDRIAPRITFAAHMAPLDIKFNSNGTGAWVPFHGSWNRDVPIGYKLSFIQFDGKGSPRDAANSTTAAVDIVSNRDISACPDNCFRPVAVAWDDQGRLFMTSDSTGEIFMITRDNGSGVDGVSQATSGSPTSSSPPSASTSSSVAGMKRSVSHSGLWFSVFGAMLSAMSLNSL